jgi:hypothetical protein
MIEQCNCEACFTRGNHSKDKNNRNTSWFKENIAQISNISQKALEDLATLGKKTQKNKFFRITISEYNEDNKTVLEYSREIDILDFTMLLDEFFNLDDDDFDVDNPEYEDDVRVFKSLDEVIDFLQQKSKEDEQ